MPYSDSTDRAACLEKAKKQKNEGKDVPQPRVASSSAPFSWHYSCLFVHLYVYMLLVVPTHLN